MAGIIPERTILMSHRWSCQGTGEPPSQSLCNYEVGRWLPVYFRDRSQQVKDWSYNHERERGLGQRPVLNWTFSGPVGGHPGSKTSVRAKKARGNSEQLEQSLGPFRPESCENSRNGSLKAVSDLFDFSSLFHTLWGSGIFSQAFDSPKVSRP